MLKLFHYTDVHGLLGMVQNKEIWANDIHFMNDHQEFYEGFNMLNALAKDTNSPHNSAASNFLAAMSMLNSGMGDRSFWGSINAISFCSDPDSLDMWRGYSPGTQKFCIEFDVDLIIENAKGVYGDVQLIECVYGEAEKRSAVEQFLDGLKANDELESTRNGDQVGLKISTASIQRFLDLSLPFKNSGFLAEGEKRVVIKPNPTELIYHRANSFGITPYLKIPLPPECIHSICIGPSADFDRCIYSLKQLFLSHKEMLAGTESGIRKSNISYRD